MLPQRHLEAYHLARSLVVAIYAARIDREGPLPPAVHRFRSAAVTAASSLVGVPLTDEGASISPPLDAAEVTRRLTRALTAFSEMESALEECHREGLLREESYPALAADHAEARLVLTQLFGSALPV